jgi:hypothetical protein
LKIGWEEDESELGSGATAAESRERYLGSAVLLFFYNNKKKKGLKDRKDKSR